MKLTPKDTVGLLLIVGTLGTLYVHVGPDGHASKHPSLADDGGNAVAFWNVNVLPGDRDGGVLRNQVVIVEGGLVQSIRPVEEVELPDDALVIRGDGTKYLAATSNVDRFVREFVNEDASFGTSTRDARAHLILLDGDPLGDRSRLRQPLRALFRGQWYDRDALGRMLQTVAASR